MARPRPTRHCLIFLSLHKSYIFNMKHFVRIKCINLKYVQVWIFIDAYAKKKFLIENGRIRKVWSYLSEFWLSQLEL